MQKINEKEIRTMLIKKRTRFVILIALEVGMKMERRENTTLASAITSAMITIGLELERVR